jgi:leader peptidase (prepilin peptidase)/N-methyltransferase
MLPLLGISFFAATTIPLVVYDLRERRLPNKITIPGLIVAAVSLALTMEWGKFLVAFGISALLFLSGTLISMRGWIGMGDVKLFTGLSMLLAWFDPALVWQASLWAFGVATFVVLVGFLVKKMTGRSTIALGPYLLSGFWLAISPSLISQLDVALELSQ